MTLVGMDRHRKAGTSEVLTVEEAAKILGVSRGVAYRAAGAGELPVLRLGHRLVVPRAALAVMLAKAEQPDRRPA
jgi:excisionase family DNA binding protein